MEVNEKIRLENAIKSMCGLYEQVKTIIIYAEKFADDNVCVSSINELRNALDHIFKAVESQDIEEEISKIKGHISRAGYDAYEVYSSNLLKQIVNKMVKYDSSIISVVFQDYYNKYSPELKDVHRNLANIRANKTSTSDSFEKYWKQIEYLGKIDAEVDIYIPDLEKEQQKQRRRYRANIIFTVIGAIIGGLIVSLFTNCIII
jgi:hypothetical protein